MVYSVDGTILFRDNITTGETTEYLRLWLGGRTVARIVNDGTTVETIYSHADHLGSASTATDASGNVLWREDYTQFGEPRQNPPANANDESFTGHIRDTATGLTYMQARYYDPVIGRFLSNDPVGFAEGGAGFFNRYAYTFNDPVNHTDPTGMAADPCRECRLVETGAMGTEEAIVDFDTLVDFVPVVGDVKGAADFASDPSALGAAAVVVGVIPGVGDAAAAGLKGLRNALRSGNDLPNDALVVRGVTNSADRFAGGSGVTSNPDGTLNGVSVNSAPGASVEQLSVGIPNGQVGVSTVGDVRAAGGNVVPSPTARNPNHCTMCGVTPQKAEELFTPTRANPSRSRE